jgi:hypothetical protein
MSSQSDRRSPIVGILAAALLLPLLYFASYAAVGHRWTRGDNPRRQVMNFPNHWVAVFYQPAAYVDSVVFQRQVTTDYRMGK